MDLVECFSEMSNDELLEYIEKKSRELEIDLEEYAYLEDSSTPRQEHLDFIADHIHPELMGFLHSECQWGPGLDLFPDAETEEDLEEAMEHDFPGEDDF